MERAYERHGTSFACDEIAATAVERQAYRDGLRQLVREFGDVLSLFSFMHLGSSQKGFSLLSSELAGRAAKALAVARSELSRAEGRRLFQHPLRHACAAASALSTVEGMYQREASLSDARALGLLRKASRDLDIAARLLGTTTFDASACCAASVETNGVEGNGKAFRLGS